MSRPTPPGLIPTAFERIVQSNSTAQGLNSTTKAATGQILRLSVETQNARYRDDGTDPTTNTGVILATDSTYELDGFDEDNIKFFRAAGGTSIINLIRYKYPGQSE